ncbi:MAG: hypothetical protein JO246_07230 [Frankiaceae bacterium]|nr:hypothetical protein [Frankiaceae bacterium]MBV9872700.1 hypothetical protein [Frankiaceae bacterium]
MTMPASGSTTRVTSNTDYPKVEHTPTRITEETKPAFKTTEIIFYVATVVAVLIAAQVVDGFRANQAWLYVTLLTVGYMLSRGLAKSGSYANDNDPRTDNRR